MSVGGTFGLGIGIDEESIGLQNFFLVPNLILGKTQRIMFTIGLMSGKVERLTQGYRIGNTYKETNLPKKLVYELGYFLGISFSLTVN